MKKEMLINCLQPEEIRIAILENGILEELYVERASAESYVGNIYKGRVVNIEPSIQAAFVDFGVGRNGFLHVSDVEPAYYKHLEQQQSQRGRSGERGERGRSGRPSQRHYDDYDAPQRRGGGGVYRQPKPDQPMEDEVLAPPTEASPAPTPLYYQPPADAPSSDLPDIIVEEIIEEDEFTSQPTVGEPMQEPASAFEADWPAAMESREEMLEELTPPGMNPAPLEAKDSMETPLEESPIDEGAEPESAGGDEAEIEEGKAKRKGPRRAKGKTSRAKKPRKRAAPDDAGAKAEAAPAEEPKPRPMDSSERRTDEDDPSHPVIDPRPASAKGELSDEDLSFSMAPPSHVEPIPKHEPGPTIQNQEEIIVEEEEFIEPEPAPDEYEELSSEPMEPAIAKIDIDESIEEIVEEEKAMEEEAERDDEAMVSEIISPEEGPVVDPDDDFSDLGEFVSREPGRGEPRGDRRGDRGGRGGRGGDRGGRGGDRGGRGGDRGGRGGDRRGPDRRPGGRGGDRRPSGRPGMGRPKPHIEDIFKRGQEVLVQVIKEGIGTKGPTLSTYISIAGRYLVLMPGLNRIGVSRKIDDDDVRRRLREIMNELRPPKGIGFIIRTAGQDRNKQELQSDLAYLSRLWQVVVRRIKKQKSPTEIYKESDMVTRTIRDIFTEDIDTIWVDERSAYEAAKEFMEAVMPRFAERIKFYDASVPMFHKYGIENEIARIQMRHVPLPYGGSIVVDQTEALVAIDVNSGNFRADTNNAEETAYQMNLHAAKEIARQLRLRDLGGVIVNDFIDMREERHRRGVEKALRDAVRRDRARTKILRISQFGIIEMTRQRIRPSLKRSAFQDCTHCKGTGHVKTCESVSIEVMRMLQLAVNREHITRIDIRVHDEVARYLLNRKRKEIVALEENGNKQVSITGAGAAVSLEFLEFMCYDNNSNEVKFNLVDEPPRPPRRRGN
jgi:ribonuclease E